MSNERPKRILSKSDKKSAESNYKNLFGYNSCAQATMEEQDSFMKVIRDAINNKKGSEKLENMKDVVLFIGASGNGTSTLVKLLSGDQFLFSKGEEGRYVIIDKEGQIGDPTKSSLTKTLEVEPVWFSPLDRETCYFDCPGFGNTISPHADIMSTIARRNALWGRRRAKIILVVSYQEVKTGGQRSAFLELVQYVTEFVKDIKKFKDSIALFVTKVPNIVVNTNGSRELLPDEKIKKSIVEFLESVRRVAMDLKNVPSERQTLYLNTTSLIDILLPAKECRTSKIGILRCPENAGLLNSMQIFLDAAVNLNSMVKDNLAFTAITEEDFGYTVSTSSKAALSDDVKRIVDTFRSYLSNIFREFQTDYQILEKSTSDLNIVRKAFTDHYKIWQKSSGKINGLTTTTNVLQCFLDHVEELLRTEVFKKYTDIVRQNSTCLPIISKQPEQKIQENPSEVYNLMKDYYDDILEANQVIKILKRKLQEANGEVIPKSNPKPKITQTSNREKPHKMTLLERKEELQECIKLMALLEKVVGVEFKLSTTKLNILFKKLADYVQNTYTWYTTIIPIIFDQMCSYELQNAKNDSMRIFMDSLSRWAEKSDEFVITAKQLVDASSNGIGIPIELDANVPKIMHLHRICKTALSDPQIVVKDNCLRVTGVCVSLSYIVRKLLRNIREIEIFASERIIIDFDLNLTGNGINLFIAAPKWEVVGEKRSIILDGMLRDMRTVPTNVCSGSFFGIGEDMVNGEVLEISTCACYDVKPMMPSVNENNQGLVRKCYNKGKSFLVDNNQVRPLKDGFHAGLALLIGFRFTDPSIFTVWNDVKIKELNNCRCNFKNYRRSLADYYNWFKNAQHYPVSGTCDGFQSLLNSITSNNPPNTIQGLLTQHIEIMKRLKTAKGTSICRASNALLLHDIFSFLTSPDKMNMNHAKVVNCLFLICVFQHYSNFFESFDDNQLNWINGLSNDCMVLLSATHYYSTSFKMVIDRLYLGSYESICHTINGTLLTASMNVSQICIRECINYFGILLNRTKSTSAITASEAYPLANYF